MRQLRVAVATFVVAALLAVAAGEARADSYRSIDNTSAQEIVAGMSDKFVRGVGNVVTGWLELPNQIVETYRSEGLVPALTSGPLRGLGMTFVRTGSGALETLTFWFPIPGFYDPMLKPNYVWQDK